MSPRVANKAEPTDNPFIIAAKTVNIIFEIVHGQAAQFARETGQDFKTASQQLTTEVLCQLQLLEVQQTA